MLFGKILFMNEISISFPLLSHNFSGEPKYMKYNSLLLSRNFDAITAAIAGFLIIFVFSRHGGIGVSPDSVVYMSVAANIHDHGVISDFTNGPLVDFPFFYPIFLSGVMFLTGLACAQFGAVLNGLLFATLIYTCGWMMEERFSFRSKWYKRILLSFIVFSPCLLAVYSMIWSETLFLLLLLAFILCTGRYFQSHSVRALLLMAFVTGLSCITRYAGITMIGTGGLLILCDTDRTRLRRFGHLLLFGTVSFIPPVINLIRNKLLTTTLTGFREKGVTPFGRNLYDFGSVFCDWMPFFNTHYRLTALAGAAWIVFFIAAFIVRYIKRQRFFSLENIATAYFIVYAIFILLSATMSRFQTLDDRLLSPLFIPWIWGATCWIPVWMPKWKPNRRKWLMGAAIVLAFSFQAGQLLDDYETWDGVKEAGIPGYTEADWRNSATMNFVRQNKAILQRPGATLYSNAFDGIWFLTGIRADLIPHKDFAKDVREFLAEDHFYLVWFNDGVNPDLLSIDYISRRKHLAGERIFNDGAVYYFVTDSTAWKHPAFK